MSLDILKSRVKEGDLTGVFMFWGQEEYTKDHYASILRKTVEKSPLPEFNRVVFDASAQTPGDFAEAVFALPYMWDKKLIEIVGLDPKAITVDDGKAYAETFSDLPDYLTVLLLYREDEYSGKVQKPAFDGEKETKKTENGFKYITQAIKENGLIVEFSGETTDKLAPWIAKHLKANGAQFEQPLVNELISYCGSDMYVLHGEIQKLAAVYDGKHPLTVNDVRKYCCVNHSFVAFNLIDALNSRDIVRARSIYAALDTDRKSLGMIIGAMAFNCLDLITVKTGLDAGLSFDQIAKNMKIDSWRVRKAANTVSKTDLGRLGYIASQISQADIKIKSFSVNPDGVMELMMHRICTYGSNTNKKTQTSLPAYR